MPLSAAIDKRQHINSTYQGCLFLFVKHGKMYATRARLDWLSEA